MTKKHHQSRTSISNGLRDQLEELRKERRLNYSQFAREAGVPLPQYNAWRNNGVVPGGVFLKLIAERLGVTVDWLLCIEGAQKRPGQSLPDAEIEKEIAAYARGAIAAGLAGVPWGQGVTIMHSDDMPRVGRRVVELGVRHLLSELYERLGYLAAGETVRFTPPFRVQQSGLGIQGRAVLRRQLINSAPPWPDLSTQLRPAREVTEDAKSERKQPHAVVAVELASSMLADRDAPVIGASRSAGRRFRPLQTEKRRKAGRSKPLR